jgi:hypothetical protein
MNRLLVDDTLRKKLNELQSETEFCDQSGKVLGYFIPFVQEEVRSAQDKKSLSDWISTQISDEELERRAQEPAGLTTAEVLKKLHALEAK